MFLYTSSNSFHLVSLLQLFYKLKISRRVKETSREATQIKVVPKDVKKNKKKNKSGFLVTDVHRLSIKIS